VSDVVTDSADQATEPSQPVGTAGEPRRRLVVGSLALVVIVAVGLAVVASLLSGHNGKHPGAAVAGATGDLAGPDAVAAQTAASNETRATLTYSYKSLAADFAAAEKGLTPQFAANYKTTTAQRVSPLATRYHATSTAVVADAGVDASTATTATVLLFVDQTVQNTQLAHPRLDRSRIKVSMVKVGGRWLVNDLSPI
jgi:Mce-associated membrane protein